ncbi:MAG TPA: hypothetical protein VM432_01040 [Bdellovibrionales bacterium]|nr:hypothetical protein [Bdellovibrionales bacterium]
MKKNLLVFSILCAFVSSQASAGVSTYTNADGEPLSIDHIQLYMSDALPASLVEAIRAAARDTNAGLGREAVGVSSKLEAGVRAEQDMVSTITLGGPERFEEPSERIAGSAYWIDTTILETDVQFNPERLNKDVLEDAQAREALKKFLKLLIKE